MKNKLIILSCSRSGSTFTKKLISSNSKYKQFGHEKILLNGGIGWKIGLTDQMSIKDTNFWISLDSHTVLHQVRNPLKVFATIYTHNSRLVAEIERNLNIKSKTRLEFAMRYWLKWNKICHEKAEWTYKVEDLLYDTKTLKKLMSYTGCDNTSNIIIPPSNVNTRLRFVNQETVSIKEMQEIDTNLTEEVIAFAKHLGYNLC